MTGTALRLTAIGGALATTLAGIGVFWLAVRLPSLGVEDPAGSAAAAPFVIGMVVLAATGALLIRQQPRSVLGWLLIGVGLAGVLARLTLALAVLADERAHPTAGALGWVTNWSWLPAQTLALLLILRFPDGELPSERWRVAQRLMVGWGATAVLVTALLPGALGAEQLAPRTNPLGLTAAANAFDLALSVLFAAQPVLVIVAIAAPVLRWGRASSEERQQLAAVVLALLLLAVAAPLAVTSGAGEVLEGLAWLVLPVAIAYAVARHGLWDLDLRRRFDRLRLVREDERKRLQRDLHDSLGPLLGSISMRVEAARNLVAAQASPANVDRVLASIGEDTEAAVVEVRRFIDELGPSALADADLVTALKQLVAGYADAGPRVTLNVPTELPALEAAVEIAVYRVAAEALRNAVRHAQARTCHLTLRQDGSDLVIEVVDDGVGLRDQPPGVGRRSMADRVAALGGVFTLHEPAAGGVQVSARLAEAAR